jgi:hypothetical protein
MAVGGILDSSRWAAIFARLKFAGLLYLQHFAGESPGYAHANKAALHPSIAVEWDWQAAVHISKT